LFKPAKELSYISDLMLTSENKAYILSLN